jgi:uncharacterized protein YvpB
MSCFVETKGRNGMRKLILTSFIITSILVVFSSLLIVSFLDKETAFLPFKEEKKTFEVYYYNDLQERFRTFQEAVAYAKTKQHVSVRKYGESTTLWNNYASFTVYQNKVFLGDFSTFIKALSYAKKYKNTSIYFKGSTNAIWQNGKVPAQSRLIDAPLVSQLPELPRGCEVTSLAMLLQFSGINTDKMTLAKEIKKEPTFYQKKNGKVYFGNPYNGYVGNMYNLAKPGYGVYHGPVKELAERYLPGQVVDMTGAELQDLFFSLHQGIPVWVIVNTAFSKLPDSLFQTWNTPTGPVKITYKEYSVLLTGYDEDFIYFNDPLANMKNRKIPIRMFKEAWEQMGRQAITYVPK